MLPCKRGAYLYKSASFKTILEKFKQIIKTMLKLIPKNNLEIHQGSSPKMMGKNMKNKYSKLSDLGSHVGASRLKLPRCGAICLRPVFRNLWGVPLGGGTPLDRFWYPLGHPWADVVHFLEELRSNFAPNVKDSRAEFRYFVNIWHRPHLQTIKQGFQQIYP